MDAVYVKFVLNNLDDKSLFFWPALDEIRSIASFGDELRKALFAMREINYNWELPKAQNESRAIWKARKIRGLLSTDILSFYFDINNMPKLKELAQNIEKSFSNRTASDDETVRALWELAYSICENKIYRIDEKWYNNIDGYYTAAKELFETARRIPTEFKIHGNTTKYAFRECANKYLPKEVADKKKLGFPVPINTWLRQDDCYEKVKKAFTSQAAEEFFYVEGLVKLLDKHKSGKKDYSKKIWTVYMFLMWYDIYFA